MSACLPPPSDKSPPPTLPSSPITCVSINRRRRPTRSPPTTLSSLNCLGNAIAILGHESGEISFFDLDSPEATLLTVIAVPNCVNGYVVVEPLSLEAILSTVPSGDKILVLVGVGGEGSRFEPTKVSFYDLHTPPAIVIEIVMTIPVLNVVVGSGSFAVISEDSVRVYSYGVALLVQLDTCPNICATVALPAPTGRRQPAVIVALEQRLGYIVCSRFNGSRVALPVRKHQHLRSIASTGTVTACGFEDGGLWVLGGLSEEDPKGYSIIGHVKPGKDDNAVRSRNRAFYDLPLRRRGLSGLIISPSEQFIAGVDGGRCQIVIYKIVTTTVMEGEGVSDLTQLIASRILGSASSTRKTVVKTSVVIWSFIDLPQAAHELEVVLQFGSTNTVLVCGLNGLASRYAYDPSVRGEKATLVWSTHLCPLRDRFGSTSTTGGSSQQLASDTPTTWRSDASRVGAHWDVNEHVITFDVSEDVCGPVDTKEEVSAAEDEDWILIGHR
ncbi:hypothetical protein Pmar_PMAR029469 [Perkinsus marinus ATCC 50983]|uniref:Uncharacterized protein n=2 Tax=Perkinsus marinus (strain ATCC 50983 / TXsc) TaxID=423536 RepID=C5KGR8_PERM5|nr:hypothetical protein Pmar_PMAR029469 [Perkinsus marinus ATCC 50983]EER16336.1 hypothetical protein Pmar_PMAR029469 [Perkinsus marinus ATCC 50983]|eukprot:XP_002784540.1 hypothetical protein Pmar_PMAR029469 [Perkinsus marinus ATCC 50983]